MKNIALFLTICTFIISCTKKGKMTLKESDLPIVVSESFKKQLTQTPDSIFRFFHPQKSEYEIKCFYNGKERKYAFIENGELTRTEIQLLQTELDSGIQYYISNNKYSEFNFKKAKSKEEGGIKTIEVELTRNNQKAKLAFDFSGKLLNEKIAEEKKD